MQTPTNLSANCQTVTTPSSAKRVSACPEDNDNESRSRGTLKRFSILVLDEALSSVGAENEAVIQEALDRLMVGRTTLIFAHRLSSVIAADRILVLDAGNVVESGTHDELMAKQNKYLRSWPPNFQAKKLFVPLPTSRKLIITSPIFLAK